VTLIVGIGAVVGAIVAASIAAISAGRHQKRQLAENAERQRDELQHDRHLVDLQELRGVSDEATSNLNAATRALTDAARVWAERPVGDTVLDALREAEQAVAGSARRIRIRLGDDNATAAYREAAQSLSESVRLIEAGTEPASSAERSAQADAMTDEFAALRERFFTEAHRIVESRLPPPDRWRPPR
jgi:hypothetical protein